jgi:RNA 3'-terminal phosphate cyclase (ATP)
MATTPLPPLTVVVIDGAAGEGGGQVLRTSLSLASILRCPVKITNIRGGRPKPGLQRQHVVCVDAASAACSARVTGNALNSRELFFEPGVCTGTPVAASESSLIEYAFDIGSAGSASLVLQTLLPILLFGNGPARVCIKGGTHNPLAPPFEFLAGSFCPMIARAGIRAAVELERAGFYPAGGGVLRASAEPLSSPIPVALLARGALLSRAAVAAAGGSVPQEVARVQLEALRKGLKWGGRGDSVGQERLKDIAGGGNVVHATLTYEHVSAVFTSVSDRGKSPAAVAQEVVTSVAAYEAAGDACPVDEYLADQLLLPLALAAGGRFCAVTASLHLTTNADIINRFLGAGTVTIEPAPAAAAAAGPPPSPTAVIVTVAGRYDWIHGHVKGLQVAQAAAAAAGGGTGSSGGGGAASSGDSEGDAAGLGAASTGSAAAHSGLPPAGEGAP